MIYIITPCSRPENIPVIAKTIPPECKWVIVHDHKAPVAPIDNATLLVCEDTGPVGTLARNYALDKLPLTDEDFVLFHDDDNIINPNWYNTVSKYLHEDFSIMTWGQIHKDGRERLPALEQPKAYSIDTASYMIRWKYNKDVRHELVYHHDGLYAEACAKNGPVLCIKENLAYYNYLR